MTNKSLGKPKKSFTPNKLPKCNTKFLLPKDEEPEHPITHQVKRDFIEEPARPITHQVKREFIEEPARPITRHFKREFIEEPMRPITHQVKKDNMKKEMDDMSVASSHEEQSSEKKVIPYRYKKQVDEEKVMRAWHEFNRYRMAEPSPTVLVEEKEWISPNAVRNYVMKDPVLDWLDYYYNYIGYNNGKKEVDDSEDFVQKEKSRKELFKQGNKFEKSIFEYLQEKYPEDIVQVSQKDRDDLTREKFTETINYMREGKKIICQAVLFNDSNKTFGIADFLIRSDIINEIFEIPQITPEQSSIPSPNLGHPYHYRVFDSKWSTIKFFVDKIHIQNFDRYPIYKAQLAIYTAAVGLIQGYTPPEAYIIGKNYKFQTETYDTFNRTGHVNFANSDYQYLETVTRAIQWMRNLRYYGNKWVFFPQPSVKEMYPNLSNTDSTWWHQKLTIAKKIKDLTMLWQVGYINREIAHSKGIYRWDDPRCSAKELGIRVEKHAEIIDIMINMNRQNDQKYIFSPDIIRNNIMEWKKPKSLDFYIDFETVNDVFLEESRAKGNKIGQQAVFMIGIGYYDITGWKMQTFTMKSITESEQIRIFDQMFDYIDARATKFSQSIQPRLFHWGHAETTIIKIINNKFGNRFDKRLENIQFIDMNKIFIEEPIVIKGAFGYGLKEISDSMCYFGMITTRRPRDIYNGYQAMMHALEYYKNPTDQENLKFFKSVIHYNEYDCRVLCEIINYLRINH